MVKGYGLGVVFSLIMIPPRTIRRLVVLVGIVSVLFLIEKAACTYDRHTRLKEVLLGLCQVVAIGICILTPELYG